MKLSERYPSLCAFLCPVCRESEHVVLALDAERKVGTEAGIEAGADLQRKLDTVALQHATRLAAEKMRDAIANRFEILAKIAESDVVGACHRLAAEDVRKLPATYGVDGVEHGT